MNFLDATTLFERPKVELALLSSYLFDPAFFESRLLRCASLASARRVVVLVDAGQWTKLLRDEVPARLINRRYLVVPVAPARGVFHPKLNLFMSASGAQVQCGSNNLTRAGYSRNLELLNAIDFDLQERADGQAITLAQEAFRFFRVIDDAGSRPARIAQEWLREFEAEASWLGTKEDGSQTRIRLLETHTGPLWDRLIAHWDRHKPSRFLVISPFYDPDGDMVRRLYKRYPASRIEIVAQQHTSNPPVDVLKRWKARVTLSEIRDSKRYLHAKLLHWETSQGAACLVGSANFTSAAFDGRNVEACLLINGSTELVEALFDSKFTKRPIDPDRFKLGTEVEPEADSGVAEQLWIEAASITSDGALSIEYGHSFTESPTKLRVEVRSSAENVAPVRLPVPNQRSGATSINVSTDLVAAWHGSIVACLVAEIGPETLRSLPAWVIQVDRLTQDHGNGPSTTARRRIEQTGEGLLEYLDQLGDHTDLATVIDYLNSVTIAFFDGAETSPWRLFRTGAVRDPFQPDTPADWLNQYGPEGPRFVKALHDFILRHEKLRLRRHAQRGNINGMANFLDILVMLVRLLLVYYLRGSLKRGELIQYGLRFLKIASCGIDTEDDECDGFLLSIWENLGRGSEELIAANEETNFTGYLLATLTIVQQARFKPNEKLPGIPTALGPSGCLLSDRQGIVDALEMVGFGLPSDQSVLSALKGLGLFNDLELLRFQYQLQGAQMFHGLSPGFGDLHQATQSARSPG